MRHGGSAALLVSAFGVHVGGGAVLLDGLLAEFGGKVRVAALDTRYAGRPVVAGCLSGALIRTVRPHVGDRLRALRWIAAMGGPDDTLLCFNSLPPLQRSRARTIIYVHSPHFVGGDSGIRYGARVRARHLMEQGLFRLGRANADQFWVQTETVADALRQRLPHPERVCVHPFVDGPLGDTAQAARPFAGPRGDPPEFFFPADGVAHKNHVRLFRAWARLSAAGLAVRLSVTLPQDRFAALIAAAGATPLAGSAIRNLGVMDRSQVLARMAEADALIFPSLAETFGLPLLEARARGLPIIAAERDYVRDVCLPAVTFDPLSDRSIAHAVRRFLGTSHEPAFPPRASGLADALLI